MTKVKNSLWQFFATVKLALFTLFALAAASIIGTIIKQKQAPEYYVEEYGQALAGIFQVVGLTRMYESWWFIALFTLFALNLVVCSIERLPGVWHMVRLDNLATDPGQLEKMSSTHRANAGLSVGAAADRMSQVLAGAGWKNPRRLEVDGGVLLFSQQGAWSRLGVYVVHLSILVIMVGAMIGNIFGFSAYVFLPEGRSTKNVFLQGTAEPLPLGFELQCDRFERTFYPNGMVKEFRADLTVFDKELKTPYRKSIIVNDPLNYRGISFYQADAYPLEEYFVVLRHQATGREQAFRAPAERDVPWPGGTAFFRIEELEKDESGAVHKAKIRFATDTTAEPSVFWMNNQDTVVIGGTGQAYSLSFRQLFSTLLLVKKDPGVSVVYFGCITMMLGLAVCFFFSHRRLWVLVTPMREQQSRILVSGSSNKNRPAFERRFEEVVARLGQVTEISVSKKGT